MKRISKLLVIAMLVLLILVIIAAGLFVFDRIGLINVRSYITPLLGRVGLATATVENANSAGLLNQARFNKRLEALEQQKVLLEQDRKNIAGNQQTLKQKEEQLAILQQNLEQQQKTLNDERQRYEDKNSKLRQLAKQLNNMPPQQAVAQLNQMDAYLVVDVLRQAEEVAAEEKKSSLVSYWLSLMPPERSAKLGELMVEKP